MNDSLKAVIDSLVHTAVAAGDSARAAQAQAAMQWYEPIIEHPLFKLFWPIVVASVGFLVVKWINQREEGDKKTATEKGQRSDIAVRIKSFLSTAGDMLQPLLDRLKAEGPIIVERPASYPPADNVLAYLEEFTSLKVRLSELRDPDLEHEITLWHRTTTANLTEVRDSRLMAPGIYLRTYVPRGNLMLNARFAAVLAGLSADVSNARELASRL